MVFRKRVVKSDMKKKSRRKDNIISESIWFNYQLEVKREQSILEQSGRLLVFQSLLPTALFAILPTLLESFRQNQRAIFCIWLAVVNVAILTTISLIFTLLSQYRYKYMSMPKLSDVKDHLASLDYSKSYINSAQD